MPRRRKNSNLQRRERNKELKRQARRKAKDDSDVLTKSDSNGLNFPKKAENGLNFPKKAEKKFQISSKIRIAEDDVPVTAKLFTDSVAKHLLNLLLKHI